MEVQDPVELGAEGWSRLEAFDEEADPGDLEAAIRCFDAALATDPDHSDAPGWWLGKGFAHGAEAESTGDSATWDHAVDCMSRAWSGLPSARDDLDGLAPDAVAAELAWVLVRRYQSAETDDDPGAGRIDRLVSDLDAITDPDGRQTDAHLVTLFRGEARLHRSGLLDEPADRELGLLLLDQALPQVPDDTPMLADVLLDYAEEVAADGRFDDGLAAVTRVRSILGPENVPTSVDLLEAELADQRWVEADDPADLDRAIRCGARAVDAGSDGRRRYGALLFHRGDQNASVADLDRALPLLEESVRDIGEDTGMALMYVGLTHQRRWELTEDSADLDRALTTFASALGNGMLDSEALLNIHRLRLAAFTDVLRENPGASDVRAAAAALDAAREVGRSVEIDPAGAERAALAIAAVLLDVELFEHLPDHFDIDRMLDDLRRARRHPDLTPDLRSQLVVVEAVFTAREALLTGKLDGFGADVIAGEIARSPHEDDVSGPKQTVMLGLVALYEAISTGDQAKAGAAAELLGRGVDSPWMPFIAGFGRIVAAVQIGATGTDVLGAVDDLIAMARTAGPDERLLRDIMLPLLLTMRSVIVPADVDGPGEPTIRFDGPLADALGAEIAAMQSIARIPTIADPVERRRAMVALEERAAALPEAGPVRALTVRALAGQWLEHARDGVDRPAADSAVRWSEEATATNVDGAENPRWAETALTAAQAHRLRARPGDRERSRELGLSALRGHAWIYLRAEGRSPAEALHRAQLGALNPDRTGPDAMPIELMTGGGGLPSDDPITWAGFLHLGA